VNPSNIKYLFIIIFRVKDRIDRYRFKGVNYLLNLFKPVTFICERPADGWIILQPCFGPTPNHVYAAAFNDLRHEPLMQVVLTS
jgi:hypothetical protein